MLNKDKMMKSATPLKHNQGTTVGNKKIVFNIPKKIKNFKELQTNFLRRGGD